MQIPENIRTICDVCLIKKDDTPLFWHQVFIGESGKVIERVWRLNKKSDFDWKDICSLKCLADFLNDKRRKENGNG